MAALSIRDLDDDVKARLQVRAAQHGRSMESEVRAILTEAVQDGARDVGLGQALLDRFGAAGGVDLDVPDRSERQRPVSFG
ncbi:Arc family DNA-binding protein [Klenkia sp. PcliD-1-E]|uniref:FitA-like ribbon-helix-helix domain-containing protein n=1 Tax=Klenkia sp. PcliD-1-E TaxID=2954492 RepID=UPI002097A90F|nr:Arc family DNA-binding protein [Klenkia sp. PcliD-1-E]MCO7218424.1 Arc family DNA-binding protein [Klenkia sp. PcliD-1-E]